LESFPKALLFVFNHALGIFTPKIYNTMRAHPFLPAIILGVTVAILAVCMIELDGQIAKATQISSPIIKLEFARSPDEVFQITGLYSNPILHRQILSDLYRSIAMDTWFILSYTTFLSVTIALIWKRLRARKGILLGIPLALCACAFDFLENQSISRIMASLNGGFESALQQLHIFTHIKWGSLAAVFFIIAPVSWRTGWWGRLFSILSFLAFFLALGIWAIPYTPIQLTFTLTIALLFLCLFVWIILQRRIN
jgi:hypothetical protein